MIKITKEHFEEWLASPVTEAVLKTCKQNAEDNKSHWVAISWLGGVSDALELATLRSRAEAAKELSEFEYNDLLDELRLEDENEQRKNSEDRTN